MNTDKWEFLVGSKNQSDLSSWGDFVISHRPNQFILCLRPPGKHHNLGTFDTLAEAKRFAESVDLSAFAYNGKIQAL